MCVIGGGVVGVATTLALVRRGVSVTLLEAEPELGLAASGTNSGILHTGFDSTPGELETELILASARLRPPVLDMLGLDVLRCGARMHPRDPAQAAAVDRLQANAAVNGVPTARDEDGALQIPGEWVCDPVAYVLALADAARSLGASIITGARASAVTPTVRHDGLVVLGERDERLADCTHAVNAAGLYADELATASGDTDLFRIVPRKGEFLVFDTPPSLVGAPPVIDLPVPDAHTKGVLVFPTLDGHVVAGPTAHDQEDKNDWSVRPQAAVEIMEKVAARIPALRDARPIFAYAGLRPAGDGDNYVFAASSTCPGLIHVGAIRSTGLSASLGIAEHVVGLLSELGLTLRDEQPLPTPTQSEATQPWWQRSADHWGTPDR